MQLVAAPGLAVYCLLVTIAAVDLLMSLDPHWFSTIYGVYVVGGQAISGIAFTLLVAPLPRAEGADASAFSSPATCTTTGSSSSPSRCSGRTSPSRSSSSSGRATCRRRSASSTTASRGGWGAVSVVPRPLPLRRAVRLPPLARLQARHREARLGRGAPPLHALGRPLLARRSRVSPRQAERPLARRHDARRALRPLARGVRARARERDPLLPANDPNLAVALEVHAHG